MPTSRFSSKSPRRRSAIALRVCIGVLIALLASPPTASAQLLSTLLRPVLEPLTPILNPLLNPILSLLFKPAKNQEQKLDASLRAYMSSGSTAPVRVIVTTVPGRLGLVGQLLALVGGVLRAELQGLNALVADVTGVTLLGLMADPNVQSISIDAPVQAIDGNLVAPAPGTRWPLPPLDGAADTNPSLRATLGLSSATPAGNGVGIAILDSGIAASGSADFAGRVSAFYDFTAGKGARLAQPVDPYGHGTHVAGIIASSGVSSSGGIYRGIGPNARLIGLRVLDQNGGGRTSDVIGALEFAIAQRRTLGIDIINLSLGHPIYERVATDPLVRAVERAVDAGIVVVVSAGNYGYNRETGRSGYAGITSPGNAPSAITIGALRTAGTIARNDDDVAPYSSRGPTWYDGLAKPDLLAPGHAIVSKTAASSALYATYPDLRAGASHMRLNGTSMAAAAATGVVALVVEAHKQAHPFGPALTPNTIKAILQYTATPVGDEVAGTSMPGLLADALTQGAGAINAPGAMALARGIDAGRPVGSDWFAGAYDPVSNYGGEPRFWAQTVTWGAMRLTGELLNRNRRAWTPSVDWGFAVPWESDVVAVKNVVWDRSLDWAANVVWGPQLVGTASGTANNNGGNNGTDGQTYTWGYVDDPATAVWGNLAASPTGGQTYVWSYTDR